MTVRGPDERPNNDGDAGSATGQETPSPENEAFAVFPEEPAPELVRFLDIGGYKWIGSNHSSTILDRVAQEGNQWSGAIVAADKNPEEAWRFCRELRKRDSPIEPLLVVINGTQLAELESRSDLFDDFVITPFHPDEVEARLQHLLWRSGRGARPELVIYGPLTLNVETYQAILENRPLDLTFMEYELLKFLATSPGQVFNRETLLNRVWGYEYFGGARTVDVHVRRLRAKMGQEHASLITTIRGVGYKLGQSRWQAT